MRWPAVSKTRSAEVAAFASVRRFFYLRLYFQWSYPDLRLYSSRISLSPVEPKYCTFFYWSSFASFVCGWRSSTHSSRSMKATSHPSDYIRRKSNRATRSFGELVVFGFVWTSPQCAACLLDHTSKAPPP